MEEVQSASADSNISGITVIEQTAEGPVAHTFKGDDVRAYEGTDLDLEIRKKQLELELLEMQRRRSKLVVYENGPSTEELRQEQFARDKRGRVEVRIDPKYMGRDVIISKE